MVGARIVEWDTRSIGGRVWIRNGGNCMEYLILMNSIQCQLTLGSVGAQLDRSLNASDTNTTVKKGNARVDMNKIVFLIQCARNDLRFPF
jgi:hypothetical protein